MKTSQGFSSADYVWKFYSFIFIIMLVEGSYVALPDLCDTMRLIRSSVLTTIINSVYWCNKKYINLNYIILFTNLFNETILFKKHIFFKLYHFCHKCTISIHIWTIDYLNTYIRIKYFVASRCILMVHSIFLKTLSNVFLINTCTVLYSK